MSWERGCYLLTTLCVNGEAKDPTSGMYMIGRGTEAGCCFIASMHACLLEVDRADLINACSDCEEESVLALGISLMINMLTFFVDKRKVEKSQRGYPQWTTSLVQHQL